ncbi:MAG TPA: amidohydrolase family protein, partial [Anaerolineae bacterium]|nr:amidohydrolase family protein [Anaerolineae bacterium]
MKADLVVHSSEELLTLASPAGPKRGPAMRELSIVERGAVALQGDRIVLVGNTEDVLAKAGNAAKTIDASGKVVLPGFVDPHTHVIFAGDRASEFELRLQGASYMEIMAAGGGIMNTVRATRA